MEPSAVRTPKTPRTRRSALLAALCGLLMVFSAPGPANAKARAKAPQSSAVSPADVELALATLAAGDPCRDAVRAGLVSGERTPELTTRCARAWTRAAGRLYRAQRPRFGLVDRRQESLAQITVLLSTTRHCRRWILRDGGRGSLIPADARREKCSIRRFRGALPVYVIDAEGARMRALEVTDADDGRYIVRYSEVDAALRLRGKAPLERWSYVELGEAGWAGRVDLREIRTELAERHRGWVERGRGVPALFVIRHPEHRDADEVRLLAEEARFLRQSEDYQAVLAGEMTPQRFLDRYLVSRFHRSVRSLESFLAPEADEPDDFSGEVPLADEDLESAQDPDLTLKPTADSPASPAPDEAASVCPPGAANDDECTPSTPPPPDDPRPRRRRGDDRPSGFLGVPSGL